MVRLTAAEYFSRNAFGRTDEVARFITQSHVERERILLIICKQHSLLQLALQIARRQVGRVESFSIPGINETR